MEGDPMEILLITGMSGAGKSNALRTFEDLGYYCMDNLPPALLDQFIELCYSTNKKIERVAIGIDTRGGIFFEDFFKGLESLSHQHVDFKILFMDADDHVLVKRYKELRRPHPLNPDGSLTKGIEVERERLEHVKQIANYILDTSNMSSTQLKHELRNLFKDGALQKITISIVSFGFKNGILLDGDMIFDVRFLPNPFYIQDLRPLNGLQRETKDFIFSWEQTDVFIEKAQDMIEFLLPHYVDEGKTQLVIGIGCTGGFHRSVAIAEELKSRLVEDNHRVTISHRDLR